MSGEFGYDEEAARREEANYRTDVARERRSFVRERLALESDERVLSVGCGPGFEPAGIAGCLGGSGTVYGLDANGPMLELARKRCEAVPGVSLLRGDAAGLPFADGAFDAAASVQVYEYVEDLGGALSELRRVLAPDGRAVVYATDWDSLVWHSSNRERMNRVLEVWNRHCARPHLGSRLASHLREAGFAVRRVEPHTILETGLDGNAYAGHLLAFVREFVADSGRLDPSVIASWEADLRAVDRNGSTFFSLSQYLYLVEPAE